MHHHGKEWSETAVKGPKGIVPRSQAPRPHSGPPIPPPLCPSLDCWMCIKICESWSLTLPFFESRSSPKVQNNNKSVFYHPELNTK
jgi:hypothetical protein